jgi:hypothetical protein
MNQIVKNLVLNKASQEGQIIYGARAINRQVSTPYQKETSDYDVLTKKPKKSAKELVNELNKRYEGKYKLEKAVHKGTYKVKQIDTHETVVDYTQLKKTPKTKNSWGNKFKEINSIKQSIKKSINKKGNEFRKEKDEDSLRRIKLNEETFNF